MYSSDLVMSWTNQARGKGEIVWALLETMWPIAAGCRQTVRLEGTYFHQGRFECIRPYATNHFNGADAPQSGS